MMQSCVRSIVQRLQLDSSHILKVYGLMLYKQYLADVFLDSSIDFNIILQLIADCLCN